MGKKSKNVGKIPGSGERLLRSVKEHQRTGRNSKTWGKNIKEWEGIVKYRGKNTKVWEGILKNGEKYQGTGKINTKDWVRNSKD